MFVSLAIVSGACASIEGTYRKGDAKVYGPGLNASANAVIDELATVKLPRFEPASKVWRVSSEKAVDGEVSVRLPLLRSPGTKEAVVGLTAQHRYGPWRLLPAVVDIGGNTVTLSTNHFSWFTAVFFSTEELIRSAKKAIVDGLSSGAFAEASPPTCAGEAEARSAGYTITSDTKDTVFWCLGYEGGRRILKVVNRRRYPLVLSHAGLTQLTQGHWNGLATLSRFLSSQRTIVPPRESVTFQVDDETPQLSDGPPSPIAKITTEFDGVGQSLYQLQIGVETALSVLTKFGFKHDLAGVDALAALVKQTKCATSLENPNDVGGMMRQCLGAPALRSLFGAKGLWLAPLLSSIGLVGFFQSEFNALGDLINGRDQYWINLSKQYVDEHAMTTFEPELGSKHAYDSFVGQWTTHAGNAEIRGDGTVVLKWFINMYTDHQGASGMVEIDLQIISSYLETQNATARVTARIIPVDVDPTFGPGGGPNLNVGDLYVFSLRPPGLMGETQDGADKWKWCAPVVTGSTECN